MTRVAVIGVGAMGRNHARVLREMPRVTLVAVSDPDGATARRVAELHGVSAYPDYLELIERERPDAVTVAVPTVAHHQVVSDALQRGCHVLVEKPIAETVEEAADLTALAVRQGRLLMVGHIERFNSAVLELKRRLVAGQLGRVFQANARRLGPFPARIRDVGVVVDLATHDIDILRYLSGSQAVRVFAEARREVHTSREDMINGLVRFADGMLALLEINWLTPTKIRELSLTGERGMFRVDYLTQDLYFFENPGAGDMPWDALTLLRGGVNEGMMIRYALQKKEPLRTEIEAFIRGATGDPSDVVSAEDGTEALRLALALIESAQRHEVVSVERQAAPQQAAPQQAARRRS